MVLRLFLSILLVLPGGLCILNCSPLHDYTVESAGSDSKECTSGHSNTPCKSLAYLFQNIPTNSSCINVTILSNLSLSSNVEISSLSDVVVTGNGVNISCAKGCGLVFNNTTNVLLQGLQFLDCSMECSHNNTGIYPHLVDHAAICMSYSSNISIAACSFANGNGTGVIMHDVIGTNQLVDTNFTGMDIVTSPNKTSGGLIIKRQSRGGLATYILDGCTFADNGNRPQFYCCGVTKHPSGLGGGVHLHLGVSDSTSHVHLNSSLFRNNSGLQGGGLHLNHFGDNSLVYVNMSNSIFHCNHAKQEGGGVWLMQDKASLGLHSKLNIVNTNFSNNSADWGGGLAVYRGYFNGDIGNITVEAKRSNWIGNIANAGSGGYAVGIYFEAVGIMVPGSYTKFHLQANFSNCSFHNNVVKDSVDPSSVGAVQIGGTRGLFTDCDFQSNSETALFVREFGFVEFAGNTSFIHNRGIRGAAIFVDYSSAIGLIEGVELNFESNYAIIDGGAIFTEPFMSDLYMPPNDDNICLFEYLHVLSKTPENYKVRFSNNLANGKNRSIFVGTSKGCVNNDTILLFNSTIFSFDPRNVNQIQSLPYHINLECDPCINCTIVEVMLGQQFYIKPSVTDIFKNSAYLFGYLQLVSYDNDTHKVSTLDDLELVGPSMISMDNFTKNNELYLKGHRSYMTADNSALRVAFMHTKPSKTYSINYTALNVSILNCMLGYMYNESSEICECEDSEYVSCSSNHSYACIRYGYWLGDYSDTYGKPYPCSGHNCWYANGHCPKPLTKCKSLPDFCRLSNSSDDLCWGSKSGIMCSECKPDHAFTFSAVKCVNSSSCSRSSTAIIMFGIVVYWVAIIGFILIILNLEVRIGLGFLYGIVYYFSVLSVFTDKTITDSVLLSIINTCIAITQLCPRAFGDINVCFVESWSRNLHHHLFHYVTPIFVICTIVAIILVCKYCRVPRAISLAENSPIHAICTLVLLSYTAVTYTSFEILKPVRIKGELRVYTDPSITYFGREHLPYAIIALLFEGFVSLPICLLLLFAPLLVGRVNLVRLRLQPIVDDLQACYHPKCRWFAGFYFLSRQLVYLANIIPSNSLPQESPALHFANAIVLIVHSLFQPYRLKWLNAFDTLLLIDIFFLSFFDLGWSSSFIHKTIPYILILPPALYLLAVVVLVTGMRALKCLWSVKAIRTRLNTFRGRHTYYSQHTQSRRSNSPITSVGPSAATYTTVGLDEEADTRAGEATGRETFEDTGEREPLLADSYAEQSTYVFQSCTTNNTSSSRDSTLSRFPPRTGTRKTATN